MSEVLSGAEFKKQLREGKPKLGLFLNSHSPTVAEQLAHSGYDWLLVDTQHGPMGFLELSAMLAGISSGGAKSLVRVAGYHDRGGIQQSLDMGADGVLVPYINTAEEARQAVSCTRYPTAGTRSVYFPQRSMNKAGLLGYAGAANENIIVALQVETADCIKNIDEIAAVPGVDCCSSARTTCACRWACSKNTSSPTCTRRRAAGRHRQTARRGQEEQRHPGPVPVRNFARRRIPGEGLPFISVGNDLHHILTQAGAYVKDVEAVSKEKGKAWTRRIWLWEPASGWPPAAASAR
jgi:4-hydroxy-2-oxoheptanedioate aldolase